MASDGLPRQSMRQPTKELLLTCTRQQGRSGFLASHVKKPPRSSDVESAHKKNRPHGTDHAEGAQFPGRLLQAQSKPRAEDPLKTLFHCRAARCYGHHMPRYLAGLFGEGPAPQSLASSDSSVTWVRITTPDVAESKGRPSRAKVKNNPQERYS